MKILLFAPEANVPNKAGNYMYQNIRSTFIKLGHEIIDYDFWEHTKRLGKEGMHADLKALIDARRPHLFFHGIYEDEADPAFLDYVTRNTSTTTMVLFSDDDWRFDHSLQWVGHYSIALTTCIEAEEQFRKRGHENVLLTQWGCNTDLYYPLDVPQKYAITFVGQAYRGRPELVDYLRHSGVAIDVWGEGWEAYAPLRTFSHGFLPHFKTLEVFSASNMVLNMAWCSKDGQTPQIKGRTFEHPACKVFQLSNFDKRVTRYFEEDKEIVFYRDKKDLVEKIAYYSTHADQRRSIAEAAYRRTLRDHTWERRFEEIFKAARGMPLSGKQPLTFKESKGVAPAVAEEGPRPGVSIACYVFNGQRYFEETIQSVLGQTYRDFEFIILDDGSTDATAEIVKKYRDDPRIRYYYQENIGRNLDKFDELLRRVIAKSRGELFCAIGSDDVLMPQKLERQVAAFDADGALDIAFSDAFHINAAGQTLSSDFNLVEAKTFTKNTLLRLLFKINFVAHPTVMMKRSIIDALGGFETGFASDYHFWLKAALYAEFAYVNEKLMKYRMHEKSASTGTNNKTLAETHTLLNFMRKRLSILDLYPEIAGCTNADAALYSAYLDFGNLILTANIPVAAMAIAEYQHALEHRPSGVEALNNLGVAMALGGLFKDAGRVFELVSKCALPPPNVQYNLSMIDGCGKDIARIKGALRLASEEPPNAELFGALRAAPAVSAARHTPSGQTSGKEHGATGAAPALGPSGVSAHLSRCPDPLVSVIVPTFNRPSTLCETLKSVLDQTFSSYEIIVINDAGCDVENIVSHYNKNKNITYVLHNANKGLAAARNTGIRIAKGKYLAYVDDDDVLYPNHLETLATFLTANNVAVAYTDACRATVAMHNASPFITKRELLYSFDFDPDKILIDNLFPVLCIMHQRACLDQCGVFDESLTTHEDWDLWIRLSRHFAFSHIKRVTAEYRHRADGSTMTSGNSADFLKTRKRIYDTYKRFVKGKPGIAEAQRQALARHEQIVSGMPLYDFMEAVTQLVECNEIGRAFQLYDAHRPRYATMPELERFDSLVRQLRERKPPRT